MINDELGGRARRNAVVGYALGIPGALLLGLFVFLEGFSSGWGQDSIGAGIVIGILAPAVFLGTILIVTVFSAWAVWSHSKTTPIGFIRTSIGVAMISLLLYFSTFIPVVREATDSARAWQGHSLPAWWDAASLGVVYLSMACMLSSLGLTVFSLRSARKGVRQPTDQHD